jgi:hypothetical protein
MPMQIIRETATEWVYANTYTVEIVVPSAADLPYEDGIPLDSNWQRAQYKTTFRTPEYFLYYPDEQRLAGWRLVEGAYQPMTPNEHDWLWSQQLNLWLGTWQGYSDNYEYNTWLRFYDLAGNLIPNKGERAEAEAARRAELEARLRQLETKSGKLEE